MAKHHITVEKVTTGLDAGHPFGIVRVSCSCSGLLDKTYNITSDIRSLAERHTGQVDMNLLRLR